MSSEPLVPGRMICTSDNTKISPVSHMAATKDKLLDLKMSLGSGDHGCWLPDELVREFHKPLIPWHISEHHAHLSALKGKTSLPVFAVDAAASCFDKVKAQNNNWLFGSGGGLHDLPLVITRTRFLDGSFPSQICKSVPSTCSARSL